MAGARHHCGIRAIPRRSIPLQQCADAHHEISPRTAKTLTLSMKIAQRGAMYIAGPILILAPTIIVERVDDTPASRTPPAVVTVTAAGRPPPIVVGGVPVRGATGIRPTVRAGDVSPVRLSARPGAR